VVPHRCEDDVDVLEPAGVVPDRKGDRLARPQLPRELPLFGILPPKGLRQRECPNDFSSTQSTIALAGGSR
jgi:hypothetical protein